MRTLSPVVRAFIRVFFVALLLSSWVLAAHLARRVHAAVKAAPAEFDAAVSAFE